MQSNTKWRSTLFKWLLLLVVILANVVIGSRSYAAEEEEDFTPEIVPEVTYSGDLEVLVYPDEEERLERERNRAYLLEAHPPYYKHEYLLPQTYQRVNGPCWALSITGALEGAVEHQTGERHRYSAAHLSYFARNSCYGEFKDGITDLFGNMGTQAYWSGGSQQIAMQTFLRGSGPVYEEDAPFTKYVYNRTKLLPVEEEKRYLQRLNVPNMYRSTVPEVIKDYIMKYGPVSFSYPAYEKTGGYYNYKTAAYHFNDATATTSHAAIIVGWDDNFSKDNFGKIKPQNDGAWIVRNSWGTNWGDNGYEYISYETFLTAYAFEMNDKKYDNMYNYIGNKATITSGSKLYANCFTAKKHETLKAFSAFVAEPGDATVYIFKNPVNIPDDGELVYKGKVRFDAEYQQFELPEPIDIEAGERFSIVLFGVSVMFEGTNPGMVSNPGESFAYQNSCVNWEYAIDNVVSDKGLSKWVDTATGLSEYRASCILKDLAEKYKWHNIAIYAFTDDAAVEDDFREAEEIEEKTETVTSNTEIDYSGMPVEVVDVAIQNLNELTVVYYSPVEIPAKLYVGIYDEDGRLIEIEPVETLDLLDNTTVSVPIDSFEQNMKLFLWSNVETVEPLARDVSLTEVFDQRLLSAKVQLISISTDGNSADHD